MTCFLAILWCFFYGFAVVVCLFFVFFQTTIWIDMVLFFGELLWRVIVLDLGWVNFKLLVIFVVVCFIFGLTNIGVAFFCLGFFVANMI